MLLQLAPGANLLNGKYLLSSKLGEGGMAAVWAATCAKPDAMQLPDEVVLKVLLPEIRKDPEKRKFFLEEARLSTSLDHPHIVRVFKVEQWNDLDLLVMERLWGHGLDEMIKLIYHEKEGFVPWPLALRMTAMIAEALHYANNALDRHGQRLNVIHRDIKPGNILLTADGQIKVIDFGIAKASTSQLKTQTGMVKGTIAYMSPEQLRGEKLDIRSDLFSLGVVLFELCTGHRPFYGENFTAMMFNILTKPALDPSNFRSNLPEDIRDLIMALLDKDRSVRPSDAEDLRRQLEAIIAREPTEGSIKALKQFFAELYPDLIEERTLSKQLLAKTDPESLLNQAESDALAAQAEAFRGGTLGLDALQSQDGEFILPTGEMVQGVRSTMRAEADPNAAQPPTQLIAKTPAPFASPTPPSVDATTALPVTSDAIDAQSALVPTKALPVDEIPSAPNRMLYVLSFLILLLGGGGAGLYAFITANKQPGASHQQPTQTPPKRPALAAGRTAPQPPAKQPARPTPQPQARVVAPPIAPRKAAPSQPRPPVTRRRTRRRRRRRVARISRRTIRRTIRRRLSPRPSPAAPTKGHTQIIVTPPCTAYHRGATLGVTSDKAVLSAPTGRYTVRCESKRHFFNVQLTVPVAAGSQLKRPFRLRRGTLRILATHWGNVYLVHPQFGDKKLGVTNRKYKLYQGVYTLVVRHGAKFGVKKKYRIKIRPSRTTTLKVRW